MSIKSVDVTKVPVIDLTATGRNITKLRKRAGILRCYAIVGA